MKLVYLPLEPYKSRYTFQLSAKDWGWMERKWQEAKVDYVRVDPQMAVTGPLEVKTGVVLDCFRRSSWALRQVDMLLAMIEQGRITSDDVIYLEDFFHPGAEAIPYCCHLKGVRPKVFAYWWAQSVDEYDFTYAMKHWMGPHEVSQLTWLDGVFVACPSLKKMIERVYQQSAWNKVHVIGLPFDSREVLSRCPSNYQGIVSPGSSPPIPRKNQVVFSSRWDSEKNPEFFCHLAGRIIERGNFPDATFVVCTGAKELRSNDDRLIEMVQAFQDKYPTQFLVCTNSSKAEYYQTLCESKVQFNCADQDWVSFTLLEASVCGAYPIYPRFRSFPETLDGVPGQNYLYTHKNLDSAVAAVDWALGQQDLWTPKAIRGRSWIHRRFDQTWRRMLDVMGVPRPHAKLSEGSNVPPFGANSSW